MRRKPGTEDGEQGILKRCRLTSKQRQSPLDLGVHTSKEIRSKEIRDINPFLQRLDSIQCIVQLRILRRVAALR